MKCSVCGGNCTFKDGKSICDSCGTRSSVEKGFDSTEVFIAAIEFDDKMRRKKDSVIAKEIFQTLSSQKISCFLSSISAADLVEDDAQMAEYEAIYHAKIVILVASSKDDFSSLIHQYSAYYEDKTVIPVFCDMFAVDLPPELLKYQAVNHSTIGATQDLCNTVKEHLGIKTEVNLNNTISKAQKKKRKLLIVVIAAILLLLSGTVLYIIFGTHLVLDSKKYEYAISLTEQNKPIDALTVFSKLGDYQDSKNQIKKIYNNYEGYFVNKDKTLSIYVDISNQQALLLEIVGKQGDTVVKAKGEGTLDLDTATLTFSDSLNHSAKATIKLLNSGIQLKTTGGKQSNCICETQEKFLLTSKTDKPLDNEVTKDQLIKWLDDGYTISQIKAKGYELVFEQTSLGWKGRKIEGSQEYRIANTDIKLWFLSYDTEEVGFDFESSYLIYDDMETYALEDAVLVAISAPASILLPEKVGKTNMPLFDEKNCYYPDTHFVFADRSGCEVSFDPNTDMEEIPDIITANMPVCVTGENAVGSQKFRMLKIQFMGSGFENHFKKEYAKGNINYSEDPEYSIFTLFAEGDDQYMFSVGSSEVEWLFTMNKKDYKIENYDNNVYKFDYYSEVVDLEEIKSIHPNFTDEFYNYYVSVNMDYGLG